MLVECGVALLAAVRAHSPAMLAFGADSLVELLSAMVVLLQVVPRFAISQELANHAASLLLFALAGLVAVIAALALVMHLKPEPSMIGMGITIAALVVMPLLARLKHREARRSKNAALAADAIQSATCAYLAGITLIGLSVNAALHIAWFDSAAAVAALPLLITEAKRTWRGATCGCC